MEFLALQNLIWVVPVLILIAIISWRAFSQRRRVIALLTRSAGSSNLQSNASPIRRYILAVALVAALVFACLASLRPIGGKEKTPYRKIPKNLIVLFDVSNSMTARDAEGITRSEAAKLLLRSFVKSRPADRIGLMSFAGGFFVESPVTLDRSKLLKRINDVQPGEMYIPGTDITSALTEARALLTDNPPPGSAIIILSDGDNVTGDDPKDIVSQLKKDRIPVLSIALGKPGLPTRVPGTTMVTTANHDTLKSLAQATAGLFLAASPKDLDSQVARLGARVDTIEIDGRDIAPELYERPNDLFTWPLALALLCLIVHLFLPLRTRKWHPLTTALAVLVTLGFSSPVHAERVDTYQDALALAAKDQMPVMVVFTGSDWSKLSITFEQEILTNPVFERWADRTVAWTIVDLPRVGLDENTRTERRALMSELQADIFPTAVFLDVEKNFLGSLTHDPAGPKSWITRAEAILNGDRTQADSAASVDYLPAEIKDALENPALTDVQRSIGYYNKALELEKAEPKLALASEDRFELLLDLYAHAAEAAPQDRPDLAFAARHKTALLYHRKATTFIPQSESDAREMSRRERTDPITLLKRARQGLDNAISTYQDAAPLVPGDEDFSENLALAYQDRDRVQAYLDYFSAYSAAVNATSTALGAERRFLKSLEREVDTRQEVNTARIDEAVTSIRDLITKSEAIADKPTLLPEDGLDDYRLAEEDALLAPQPHRERELAQAVQHLQDALDHLIDPQQQQPQPQQGDGEPQDKGEGEGEGEPEEGEGGRQRDNPQGDRPDEGQGGDQPEDEEGSGNENEGEQEGKGNDLKRAEKEGGDLRDRLLRKQQLEFYRNGKRIPRGKGH